MDRGNPAPLLTPRYLSPFLPHSTSPSAVHVASMQPSVPMDAKQASLDRRRRRNREAMQRARQRDREHMEALRSEAQALERTHRSLLQQLDQQLANLKVPGQSDRIVELQSSLAAARQQAETLMAQNLSFQQQLNERVKGEDRMEGLLREMAREQQIQEKAYRQLCQRGDEVVGFSPERASAVILTSRNQREQVDRLGFADTERVYLFGWSTVHRFQHEKLIFSFSKCFRNRCAAQLADRNWANEIKFVTYRSASEAATQQFHIVQKLNDDTYLIAREKVDPDNEAGVVRLLYLRFRLCEPNGSYAVVTQSVPQHRSVSAEKVWANDVCMWNHFIPVVDANGEEHCEVHLVGSSSVGDPRSVRTNVLETVMGLLRWENINVGPTLSLTPAPVSDGETATLEADGRKKEHLSFVLNE